MNKNELHDLCEAEERQQLGGELFSGKLPIERALQLLRARLLDLTSRNRLLNYRHPKARCIQFVDKPNLNLVFDRLIDGGKSILVKHVPEPPPSSYDKKRPDVRDYAMVRGIDTTLVLDSSCCEPMHHKHTPKLQALLYPNDLDRLCRRISGEARMIIEETGTNMLYLMFGFLEFYERDDSEKPTLAPLLAVPISLDRGAIDEETRSYQYWITYSGEDVNENHTLREKLSQDFGFHLPTFEEEDSPGIYLEKIAQAIQNKKRWAIKYQLSIGFLSFGKLAIWNDLDPIKWPGLLKHPLLQDIFSGRFSKGDSFFAEDYEIDRHPNSELPLIYDSDSSQHSAIIDVLSGKNIVINGPPGTGKSQTITNIIAAALNQGKKVLFVSEKLAALEVVRRRLNQAHLGHFCLELHSHKTKKKKLLTDIYERLEMTFHSTQHMEAKLSTIKRLKSQLNRYAELMRSVLGNKMGLSVHEIFWRAERYRQEIGDLSNIVQSFVLPEATEWTYDEIHRQRAIIETLGQLFQNIGSFDSANPWWGFFPKPLAPGDDEIIAQIISEASYLATNLSETVARYHQFTGNDKVPNLQVILKTENAVSELPDPPHNLLGSVFPKFFRSGDPFGKKSQEILDYVSIEISQMHDLTCRADSELIPDCKCIFEEVAPIVTECSGKLIATALLTNMDELKLQIDKAVSCLQTFRGASCTIAASYLPIQRATLEEITKAVARVTPLEILDIPIERLKSTALAVSREIEDLTRAFTVVADIANRGQLPFDGSPSSVARLTSSDALEEMLPHSSVEEPIRKQVKDASEYLMADLPLAEIIIRQSRLKEIVQRLRLIIESLTSMSEQIGLAFDGTTAAVSRLCALARVAEHAPSDLLVFRRSTLESPGLIELIRKAEQESEVEASLQSALAIKFHIDSLPNVSELKAAINTFRRGDRLFNFLNKDWRSAKRLFGSLAKENTKLKAVEYADDLNRLVTWIEHRERFVNTEEYKEQFGSIFKGLDTNFADLRKLHAWYAVSHAELVKHLGLIECINLSEIEADKLSQLAAQATRIFQFAEQLEQGKTELVKIFEGTDFRVDHTLSKSWPFCITKIEDVTEKLRAVCNTLSSLVRPSVSPQKAVLLLAAKLELQEASVEFETLAHGMDAILRASDNVLNELSCLQCLSWDTYLSQIGQLMMNLEKLCEYLSNYFESDITPNSALKFIVAKLDLDKSLSAFAPLPLWSSLKDWEHYSSYTASMIEAAQCLISHLKPAGQKNKTAKEVLEGLECGQKVQDMLRNLSGDTGVTNLLGEILDGLNTPVDALQYTFTWGRKVIDAVPSASGLQNKLLCSDALTNLGVIRKLLGDAVHLYQQVREKLDELKQYGDFDWQRWLEGVHGGDVNDTAEGILRRIVIAHERSDAVLPWSKYIAKKADCSNAGFHDLIRCLESGKLPSTALGAVFEFVVYKSVGRGIYESFPELLQFAGSAHNKTRSDFVTLDKEIIAVNGRQLAYEIDNSKRIPTGQSGVLASERTEMQLLLHELAKRRRHLPIRQLIRRAGRAIQALKPCFMMGPLSVAQYIEQGAVSFDLVVMDEASQLKPEEALGAIARGKQLVVVGDPKQLPPTSFFDRMFDVGEDDNEENTPAVLSGTDSILDICGELFHPVRTLRWHYRSQHESLIAFSNHHFYSGKLVIFPSPFEKHRELGLRYRYIPQGIYRDRQNVPEAQRVVDAVVEHMLKFPHDSLGVVTLNLTQRDLIEDLLDKKLRAIHKAEEFLSHWEEHGWPFFVKNLENVQGDERDVIFISTTFGKAAGTDKVRQNFGPISRPDGWRRLNVLFTRARHRIELFTSLLSEDIVIDDGTPAGTRALHDYLDYAKRGILAVSDIRNRERREPDSDFEIAVGDILRSKGYDIVTQLGVAGFFIDIGVRNPDRPGEFLSAIECDGAAYHSSKSARDRDRIRQEILENLGWKDRFWRIWSTDWFYNPRREARRLLDFLEQRRKISLSQPMEEYCPIDEKEVEDEKPLIFSEPESAVDETKSSSIDTFVEVGDQVTYCFAEVPNERHCVLIVDSPSNPKHNIINEHAPVAQALLGLSVGEENTLDLPSGKSRAIKVLKIQRQEEMFD